MMDDPTVKEVREAGKEIFEEAEGTVGGYFEMLRREEAKDKRRILRRPAPPTHKNERK